MAAAALAEIPRGERLLAIAITPPQIDDPAGFWPAYESALDLARVTGMDLPGVLPFGWGPTERRGLFGRVSYRDDKTTRLLDMLRARDMPIMVQIAPFSTLVSFIPEDLQTLPLDDPQVLDRLRGFVDWIHEQTRGMDVRAVNFGSEFDVFIAVNHAGDPDAWARLDAMIAATRDHVRTLPGWEDVPFSIESTFDGLTGAHWQNLQRLNRHADLIGVSYYPVGDAGVRPPDSIAADLETLFRIYPGRSFDFYQYGYPSSERIGSSEELQRRFIVETFAAWDRNPGRIRLITLTWLYDVAPPVMEAMRAETLGELSPGEVFNEFILTLGLHGRRPGTAKPAFGELLEQMRKRGWAAR